MATGIIIGTLCCLSSLSLYNDRREQKASARRRIPTMIKREGRKEGKKKNIKRHVSMKRDQQ